MPKQYKMKITPITEPQKKTTKTQKTYWNFRAIDENKVEKIGNYFDEIAPELNKEIEVTETPPSGNFPNCTWNPVREKKGWNMTPRPHLPVDVQIRTIALQEANKTYTSLGDDRGNAKVRDIAKIYEKYLKTGE